MYRYLQSARHTIPGEQEGGLARDATHGTASASVAHEPLPPAAISQSVTGRRYCSRAAGVKRFAAGLALSSGR